MMYYTIFSSALFGVRMGKSYLSFGLFTAALFFSTAGVSNDLDQLDTIQHPKLENRQCVVLLHGLARTSHSMDKMELALIDEGYTTANIDYPSRTMKIQDLSALAVADGVNKCREKGAGTINIVTHSLGGILARYYLAKNNLPEFGHLVQLAPPNQGSLIAEKFRNEQWFKWLTGPAGQQLGTGKDSIPAVLGPVDYSTAVIAGDDNNPVDNWMAEIIPGVDDGKVSVENAKVEGMADFIVLPVTHISIMKEDEVIRQTLLFLNSGRFDHESVVSND